MKINKRVILDGISNYLFFVPVVITITGIPAKWTLEQILTYMITALPIALVFGTLYGRFLNWWRRKLKYS